LIAYVLYCREFRAEYLLKDSDDTYGKPGLTASIAPERLWTPTLTEAFLANGTYLPAPGNPHISTYIYIYVYNVCVCVLSGFFDLPLYLGPFMGLHLLLRAGTDEEEGAAAIVCALRFPAQAHEEFGAPVRKTPSFFEFSLCLSRACLGKMIVF
jgi:hypothetical protein